MKFDRTINIPTLIAATTLLLTVGGAWSTNTERHARTEVTMQKQDQRIDSLEIRQAELMRTMRDEMIRRLDSLQADVREVRANQRKQ